jgi:hypothetical protein
VKQRFRGDHRNFNPDSFVGTLGRFFRPISADFDGEFTVITYERVPMDQMAREFGHFVDAAQDRLVIAQTFGGSL